MPPKKNPFGYFMDDVQRKANREGRQFKNIAELVAYAGPLWEELDENKKNKYKIKSKSTTASEKEGNFGSSSTGLLDYEEMKQEEVNIMNATVKKIISELDHDGLINKKFYLCHVNYFYGSGESYMPCEIGLVEFTIKKGISKRLQFIVNGADIPVGYRLNIDERANKFHGIDIDDLKSQPKNHELILKKIVKILDPKNFGYFPPIYSMPDNYDMNFSMSAVKSTLALIGKAGNAKPEIFSVYSLTSLFNEILNRANTKIGLADNTCSLETAEREIYKEQFLTFKNIACDFHLGRDLSHRCSLSIVTNWAYTIMSNYSNITGTKINFGTENKSRNDKSSQNKMLYNLPQNEFKKEQLITPTFVFYENNKPILETQNIQQNYQIRTPHPRISTAHLSDVATDIGKLTITE